jgi:crossover junction endodeoxyribonuclease RuvC
VWKKHHGLIGTEKAASLELARSLWPEAPLKLKKDHNKADALLMALWLKSQ